MPRIEDQYLDTIIYLYPSVSAAKNGEEFGGSGFLVGVRFESNPNYSHRYAVTNSHVIREAGATVIRFNSVKGDTEVLVTSPEHWIHHPDGDDIAVCYLGGLNEQVIKYKFIPKDGFITETIIRQYQVGPGDDVFMIGRFSRHDGKQTNLPSVRFGNISMMPRERVRHARQYDVESFLIETRSLSGSSGSPVFVYINPLIMRPGISGVAVGAPLLIWLLGIDWGHVPIYERVKEKDKETDVPEGYVVPSNSGQMAVAPIWKLNELLEVSELVMARKAFEKHIDEDNRKQAPVILDVNKPDEPTITKQSFEDALKLASRKTSEPESEKTRTSE